MTIDRVVWGRDREEAFRDRLATEYYVEAALEPGGWQVVASSLDRVPFDPQAKPSPGLPAAQSVHHWIKAEPACSAPGPDPGALGELVATLKVYAGTFSQPGKSYLLVRGDPTKKRPEVGPAGVAVQTGAECWTRNCRRHPGERRAGALDRRRGQSAAGAGDGQPRLALPFREGDRGYAQRFRIQRGPPSHPELLEWLAAAYVDGGWRLKPIHRLIVTSATYRQSSRIDEKAQAIDGGNRLLWRMSPRRLEAESIRDAILAASGKLDARMGGPGYNVWEKNTNYVAIYKPRAELGPRRVSPHGVSIQAPQPGRPDVRCI